MLKALNRLCSAILGTEQPTVDVINKDVVKSYPPYVDFKVPVFTDDELERPVWLDDLQDVSKEIAATKYSPKDRDGNPIEKDPYLIFTRVAKALAAIEPRDNEQWERAFLWALNNGATPAGRIMSNAGLVDIKGSTSTINCTVSGTIPDSAEGIMEIAKKATKTLKYGCGIGYDFSTIRPDGFYIHGVGATTSGALSYMDVFDTVCKIIASDGGRRGAQMAVMDIRHPEILNYIKAKREAGKFRQFNLSVLITDKFLNAVKNNLPWQLIFPVRYKDFEYLSGEKFNIDNLVDGAVVVNRQKFVTASWAPMIEPPKKEEDNYIKLLNGEYLCHVQNEVSAVDIWETIMESTYLFSDPGLVMIDRMNDYNNLWFDENIRCTNPCSEQPLPPDGSCLLGSINLTHCVNNPFTNDAEFDWVKFRKITRIFSRMLDNIVEINNLPLAEQEASLRYKRRHGMGYLGLGSALTMLKIKYGSDDAVAFTEEVTSELAITGFEAGVQLAIEKSPAPIMDVDFVIDGHLLYINEKLRNDWDNSGYTLKGKELLARYSKYMEIIGNTRPDLIDDICEYGSRYSHATSIAPTGSISLSFGNNASNGIEPTFAHQYFRNIIVEGKATKQQSEVCSYEFLLYRKLVDANATVETLPEYFITAMDIKPIDHVRMQAAAQKWVDSAISKTINLPTDFTYEESKDIYMKAYDLGLKGCTTYRYNPDVRTGVLVTKEDLENTWYEFELDDGSVAGPYKASDEVVYDGATHNVGNLAESIKEGQYGKF